MNNRLSNSFIKAKHPLIIGDETEYKFKLVSSRSSISVSIELRKNSLKQDCLNKYLVQAFVNGIMMFIANKTSFLSHENENAMNETITYKSESLE